MLTKARLIEADLGSASDEVAEVTAHRGIPRKRRSVCVTVFL